MPTKNMLNKRESSEERNKIEDQALSDIGDKISNLSHKQMPDSETFKEELHERLLEARREQRKSMPNKVNISKYFEAVANALTVKRLVPTVAVLILVAAGSQLISGPSKLPSTPVGEFDGYARLYLSSVHAQDNFTLEPTDVDDTGVAMDTSYVLTSKEKIETDDLLAALRVEPQIEMEVKQTGSNEWRIDTLEPVPADSVVTISLDAEYADGAGDVQKRLYSWAYQVRNQFKVLNTIPRHQATNVPPNTGIEVMFSHVGVTDLENKFTITPSVQGRFETYGRTVVFVPLNQLEYQTIYTVTLAADIKPDNSENGLAEEYSFSFQTHTEKSDRERDSVVRAKDDLYEFAANEVPAVDVYMPYHVHTAEAYFTVYQLENTDALLASLAERDKQPWWSRRYSEPQDVTGLTKVTSFNAPVIVSEDSSDSYVEFPETLPKGVYVVNMASNDSVDQFWVQVTDLAAYVNVTMTDTVVWVNDRGTGRAAENVAVNGINASLTGQTDARGLATIATPEEMIARSNSGSTGSRPYLRLSDGVDELVVELSYRYYGYYGATIDDVYRDRFWTYLSTDRPRYQTDDTIHVFGVLKPRNENEKVDNVQVSLEKEGYRDYYYRPVLIQNHAVTLAPDGSFTLDLPLKDLRPDYYTLSLAVDDELVSVDYINVQPYEKPAYEITVSPEKSNVYAGETVPVYIDAKFFDGTPVPNVELIYSDGGEERNITTDSTGRVVVNFQSDYVDCQREYGCWPTNEYINVRASSAELGEIAASTRVRVFGPNVYLKTDTEYPDAGLAKIDFDFLRIDDDKMGNHEYSDEGWGSRSAPGTRFELTVRKITWDKIETGTYYDFINKVTRKKYRYQRNESVIDELSAQADGNGEYIYSRTVEPDTSYRVEISYADELGRIENQTEYLYYYDGSYLRMYDYWNNNMSIKKNADSYRVGDQVEVDLAQGDEILPSGGENMYLFLQLQNGLQEVFLSDQSHYEFPFEARDVPNVHLGGIWFNGKNYAYTYTDRGYAGSSVMADTSAFELKIEIDSDQEQYEPGEDATVSVFVTDEDGNPVSASVNLSLIDEAYFAVADEGLPTPLSSIYRHVRSGSIFTESTHEMPETAKTTAAEGGGCFAAGTMISMADGSKKPIEQIAVGDQVATFVDPINHSRTNGEVTDTFVHTVGELLIVNDSLRLTPEHRVFTNNAFAPAGELKVGDWLLREDGTRITVNKLRTEYGSFRMYNFRVDPQHTYFADGFYVHNDKGGVRSVFVDVAHFSTITTASNGRGSVNITLPDNITSWRVTAQAVDGNLKAGANSAGIPVTKQTFVSVNAARTYLLGDKPKVRLTAYGRALQSGDSVTLGLVAPTLGIVNPQTVTASAFVGTDFALPELSLGTHEITYSMESGRGNDAMMLPIEVNQSYLRVQDVIASDVLVTDTTLPDTGSEPAAIVLSDVGQNNLYSPLTRLSWSWGHRVDQQLARKLSAEILNETYSENLSVHEFDGNAYQYNNGGLTLLPYSSVDMELSARLADLAADEFDRTALANYFYDALNDDSSTDDQITWALYGLSSLDEPVLPYLQVWSGREGLSARNRLYVALALESAGDAERAREVYLSVASSLAEQKDPYIIIHTSEDKDEVAQDTALAALVSAALNMPEHAGYWNFVMNERPRNVLLNLEQINYIQHVLPNLSPEPARVKYEIAGEKYEAKFTGESYAFFVDAQQMQNVKFLEIQGDVAYSVRVSRPATDSELRVDDTVGISREYFVGDQQTTSFKQGDIVRVLLNLDTKQALKGSYQVTDVLPSGLAPVSSPWKYGNYRTTCDYAWRPYVVDGQRVSFRFYNDDYWRCNYITYYARVTGTGEYKAEPAIIQNFLAPEIRNASATQTVTIE